MTDEIAVAHPKANEILDRGFVEVKVKVAGIWQKHKLMVEYEKTAFGKVYYLLAREKNIPAMELYRIANELQLPIKSPDAMIYPKGKGPSDFTVA